MRILHTADWHVGRSIRGHSRAAEHAAVLDEIVAAAIGQAVDLIVVVGDLFDTAAPSAESEEIVYGALLALAEVAPLVVVGGNHDSPRRLEAVAPLAAAARITVSAEVRRPDDGGVVEVHTPHGLARLALVPFVSQRGLVRARDLMELGTDELNQHYAAWMGALIGRLVEGFSDDAVNLVVAHLMVANGVLGGGERSAHTIFDYAVPGGAFAATANYVALGHLHRCQAIAGPTTIRYSGSPLQLDFGETDDEKSVTILDTAPGEPAAISTVALRAGRRLRTLDGTVAELEQQRPTVGDEWLRLRVNEPARVGLADELRSWFPNCVEVAVASPASSSERPGDRIEVTAAPRELFAAYLERIDETDPQLVGLFDELIEEDHAADPA